MLPQVQYENTTSHVIAGGNRLDKIARGGKGSETFAKTLEKFFVRKDYTKEPHDIKGQAFNKETIHRFCGRYMKIGLFSLFFLVGILSVNGNTYYVSTDGSDTNNGLSLSTPFRTIGAAATLMNPGDKCLIRGGIYRETLTPANSGSAGNPILFMAYGGEDVTISGADSITGWSVYDGDIYEAPMAWDLGDGFNQVFVDGAMMNRARWPNTGADLLSPTLAAANATSSSQVSFSVVRPADYWVGGTVYGLFGHRWTSQGAKITSSTAGGALTVSELTSTWYTGSGNAYITGVFEELDSEGEWFIKDGKLYLWAPESVTPSTLSVEAKARKWCANLSGKSYIEIRNINMFAGTISLDGSNHCEISGSTIRYQSHFTKYTWGGLNSAGNRSQGDNGVYINGDSNIIRYCDITNSAGSGILIYGSNNLITRCLIRDMDYSGTYSCPISIRESTGGNQILFNTIHDSGRDIIQLYGATSDTILYNDLYNAGRLCRDLGITYQWGRDGQGTVIAYNYIHDNLAPGSNPGIYNDNYSRGFINHHNVIWNCQSGVRLNRPHEQLLVYNNTLFNCSNVNTHTHNQYPDHMPTYWIYGNVANHDLQNNLYLGTNPSSQLENVSSYDFRLKPGASAIDSGTEVSPYTDGYLGASPDLGAYESGKYPWSAGRLGGYSGTPSIEVSSRTRIVSDNDAVLSGNLDFVGDSDATVWVVWGTAPKLLDVSEWQHALSLGTFTASASGAVSHTVTGLDEDTIYYFRFYAQNSVGGSWSNVGSFRTAVSGGHNLSLQIQDDLTVHADGARDSSSNLLIGGNPDSNIPNDSRIFIKFDPSPIPSDCTITNATLRLYHVEGDGDTYGNARLYRLIDPWTPNSVAYNHPIGANLGVIANSTGPFNEFKEISVTEILQEWKAQPTNHYGFSIRGAEGFGLTGKYFVSSEGLPGQHPELLVSYSIPEADGDSDDIDDIWELSTFGNLTTADAMSDFDKDGSTDLDEFIAGTDAADPSSRFDFTSVNVNPAVNELELTWPSFTGRTYAVEKSNDLVNWVWIRTNIATTPPLNSLTITMDPIPEHSFYRVRAE